MAYKTLRRALGGAGVARVVVEATGGYERDVVKHLRAEGFEVILLQPLQVKAFARLHLRRAKSDAIDAALIAACAALMDRVGAGHDPRLEPLADALTFAEQIKENTARARTGQEKIGDPRLRRNAELRRIALVLRRDADLARRLDLILSIPDIGERTALAIVLRMPEISREQAAALAGPAPFDDDSGKRKGECHIAGGRDRLRRSLYAAALPAAFNRNQAPVALYHRLTGRGTRWTLHEACAASRPAKPVPLIDQTNLFLRPDLRSRRPSRAASLTDGQRPPPAAARGVPRVFPRGQALERCEHDSLI